MSDREQVGAALVAAGLIHRSEAETYGADILAALREAGIECVTLPEIPKPDDDGQVWLDDGDIRVDTSGPGPAEVYVGGNIPWPRAWLTSRAVALLAAARATEGRVQ